MPYQTTIEDEQGLVLATLYTTRERYRFADGTTGYVHTVPAWCRGCQRFTLVERLRAPEEIEQFVQEYCGLRRRPLPPVRSSSQREWETIDDQLAAQMLHMAQQWRLALPNRRSAPRCLECGSIDHSQLPDLEWTDHPASIRGRVRVRPDAIHGSMGGRGRLYDTEGRSIPSGDADA